VILPQKNGDQVKPLFFDSTIPVHNLRLAHSRTTFCQYLSCNLPEEVFPSRKEKGEYPMESVLHCTQPEKDPSIWAGGNITAGKPPGRVQEI